MAPLGTDTPSCHNNVIIFWPLYLHLVVGNLKTQTFAKWVCSFIHFSNPGFPISKIYTMKTESWLWRSWRLGPTWLCLVLRSMEPEDRYVHGPSTSCCSLSACRHSRLVLGILLPPCCVSCANRTYDGSGRRRLYCWISLHNENWVLTVVKLTSEPNMALSRVGSGHRCVTLIDQYWLSYILVKERNLIIEIAQNESSLLKKFENSLK